MPPSAGPGASAGAPSAPSHAPSGASGASGGSQPAPHVAHHVAEFGEVDRLVHIAHEHDDTEAVPAPPASRKDRLAMRERVRRLRTRLFARRHLMQYFHNDTLYRSEGSRSIGPDELFLDLVIVGGIAALGHELRETFSAWKDVEKFFLLFFAIYTGWRALVITWNLWDVRSDLVDKFGIYLVFFSLIGIALGAHGAFDDGIRPYVAVFSFLATAVPSATSVIWSIREPLLKNPANVVNQMTLMGIVNIVTVLPYFAAAFVPSERATRILFWIPIGVTQVATLFTGSTYRYIHRNRPGFSRLAIAIELMVEKYEVLTMIVLGESVLGMLFEAALVITKDGARVGALYAAAAAGTAMLYSLQTLYVDVDSHIIRGGTHAIRYKGRNGIIWGNIHTFYHFALILFATGLGIALRDVAIPPGTASAAEKAVDVLIRAGGSSSSTGEAQFDTEERWMFSTGWGASLILSGVIGLLHDAGPRAATKMFRLVARFALAIGVMVGMPFADVSAGNFLVVFTVVTVAVALTEFLCMQMDRMGFFRSEFTVYASTDGPNRSDSFDDEVLEDEEPPRAPEDALSEENQEAAAKEMLEKAFQQRLLRRHCSRLVPVELPQNNEMEQAKKDDV